MIVSGSYRKVRRLQQNTPAAPAVRETLERLLASEAFGRSERSRKLIRYLVERELAGEAERLKGFSIAVDVFGKDADFDSSTDAVVRVQAGRLRELLAQYFATEGINEPLRIIIPRGTYIPAYEYVADARTHATGMQAEIARNAETGNASAQDIGVVGAIGSHPLVLPGALGRHRPPPPPGVQLVRHLRLFWAAFGIVIAMLGFVAYRTTVPETASVGDIITSATGEPPANGAVTARIATEALPTVHIQTTAEDQNTTRVASVLRRALSGFDTVAFIASGREVGEEPGKLDFVFVVSAGVDPGGVVVELQHSSSGKVLLSRTLSAEEITSSLDDQVATMLSATIPVSGILYAHIEQNGLQSGLTNCLLLNDDYYLNQNAENHLVAYKCFEALAQAGAKSPLVYSELASLHLETATDGYDYPEGATEQQALEIARKGVLMGPTSPYAHRAYGFLNSRTGTAEESMRWMKKAYELNTFDLSMAAAYAYAVIFSGNYTEGVPVMKRAIELSSAHPSWWDYGLFLGQFMLNNKAGAAQAVDALVTAKRPHYLAARLVVAFDAGDEATAQALTNELIATYPKFAADPRGTFVKAKYPADFTERFVQALRVAGLSGGS
jgi:hypothetical protein